MGPLVVIAEKSNIICDVQTRADVLILHHDKLKICQGRKLPKWVHEYQTRTHVTVEHSTGATRAQGSYPGAHRVFVPPGGGDLPSKYGGLAKKVNITVVLYSANNQGKLRCRDP